MHRRIRAALAALVFGCGLLACGSDARPAPAPALSPAPEPEGVKVELVVDHPADTLAAIHAALPPGRARALVPGTPEDLLDVLVELPNAALGRVDEDGPVRAVRIVREDDDGATVTAARINVDALSLLEGGPAGSGWIGAPGGADEPAAAVLGGVLVCSDRRWALERALPYLVTHAMRTPSEDEGVSLRFRDGVPAQLRPLAEAWIVGARERLDGGEEAARPRGRALAGWAEALRALAARLDDVSSAVLTFRAADGVLEARLTPVVREGSALARELETSEPVTPTALAAVPEGTAIAWTRSEESDADEGGSGAPLAWLEPVLGTLDEGEREGVEAALRPTRETWRTGWRGTRVAAVGADAAGPWAATWGRPGAALDEDALREVLRVPAVARALGERLDCALTPQFWIEAETGRRLPLCAHARLEVAESEDRRLVALRRSDALASAEPLALDGHGLTLSGAVWAAILVPSRAWPAAAIASIETPAEARVLPGPVSPDRIVQITLRDTGELRLRARSAAIADLVRALSPLGLAAEPSPD